MKKLIFAILLVGLFLGAPSTIMADAADQAFTVAPVAMDQVAVYDGVVSTPVVDRAMSDPRATIVSAESQAPPESALGILLMLATVGTAALFARRIERLFMSKKPFKLPWRNTMNAAMVNTVLRC